MSQFAANNPISRKIQQEATKRVSKFASEQLAKNGPKAIEAGSNAYKGFVNGLTSPTPPMPSKAGVADFAGQVGGAVAQDKLKSAASAKVKEVTAPKAVKPTAQPPKAATVSTATPKTVNPLKPLAPKTAVRMPNINANLNKPMKAPVMLNKPGPKVVNINQAAKPKGLTKTQRDLERE